MLKKLFRWIVRAVVTVFILFVIVALSEYIEQRIPSGSVLVVTLKGPVVERGATGFLSAFKPHQTALDSIRRAITHAEHDPRIVGLAVEEGDVQMDLAQAQQIAALIKKFRSTGKWTAAYMQTAGDFAPGNLPYIVAAATGNVSMMPEGELNIVGVGVRELFARGTLDWLGVTPNFAAIGAYKTAANILTQKDFTPAQHEEDTWLVNSMYNQVVAAIASERGLKPSDVEALIDQAPLSPQAGLKAHLIDRIEYQDQFIDRVKNHGGTEHDLIDYTNYAKPGMLSRFGVKDKIAVIYCDGEIVLGPSTGFGITGGKVIGSNDLVAAFNKARKDDSVRAVIFRVNSPGGSVLASEIIRRAVERTAKVKPIVVSMSGYAASGGYWVSTPAKYMIAEPGTITGSIGVLGGKFNIGPAAQKIYLNSGTVSRGANVDMFDAFTNFTPQQMQVFKNQILGETYQHFLKIVAKSRHLTVEDVDSIARGRVWTGQQALKRKLVDKLGGFNAALAEAKKLAKIPPGRKVALVELPQRAGFVERLLSGQFAQVTYLPPDLKNLAPAIVAARAAFNGNGLFCIAYCPVVPII